MASVVGSSPLKSASVTGYPIPLRRRCLRRHSDRQQPGCVTSAKTRNAEKVGTSKSDRFYLNLTGFPFPLTPLFERETIRYEVEPGCIWMFEQPQGFEITTTNVRMTVIKLKSGGLWVHAPIAPTKECLRLISELDAPVEYIVLPTYAYEHKIFVGPFSRKFPKAKVYVAPKQWSWPINLPLQFFGIFPEGVLRDMDLEAPWADEIEQKLFTPPPVGLGSIVECAFFHKSTRTLLVTDAVVCVGEKAPDVIPVENLLDQVDDTEFLPDSKGSKKIVRAPDTPEARKKGWMRNVLRVLYVRSSDLLKPEKSFEAVVGKLIVSPIMQTLVYGSIPNSVISWIEGIESDWDYRQIIPCHLDAPISASRGDLRKAFQFSYQNARLQPEADRSNVGGWFGNLLGGTSQRSSDIPEALPEEDMKFLTDLSAYLRENGALYADPEKTKA